VKMALHQRDFSLKKHVIQCGGLASVMENSFGPHGKAVLMERSGCVTITQDGIELLSSLSVCDPILDMVSRGIVDQSKQYGDGSKRAVLLLSCILRSLDKHLSSYCQVPQSVRQKMLQVLHDIKENIIPAILRLAFETGIQNYPLHNFEALGDILGKSAENFFVTKFSKLIATTLSKLFTSFIASQCNSSRDLVKLLDEISRNPVAAIVEVYNTPLLKSHVAQGFVITRNFKFLNETMSLDNVPFIFWSLVLEENEEGYSKPVIETRDHDILMSSIMYYNNLLTRCLTMLKTYSTCIIFSSVYFPDWAVLLCKKNGFSVIDMIDVDEWNFLTSKFPVNPITIVNDVASESIGLIEKLELVTLGTSQYVRLQIPRVSQVVVCGPTTSQCKQFSAAVCKFFKYVNQWLVDCLLVSNCQTALERNEFGSCTSEKFTFPTVSHQDEFSNPQTNIPSTLEKHNIDSLILTPSSDDPLPQFYSAPLGGYMALFCKYLIVNNVLGDVKKFCEITKSVTVEIFNEIPFLLFKKSRLPHERYVEYNVKFDYHIKNFFEKRDEYLLTDLFSNLKFEGHENPFQLFKILDTVIIFSQSVLRIECIMPTGCRLSQALKLNQENSDSDDYI
ncbi:hypothetical protein SK128_001397, partial [Halocaridina rubra]